MPKIKAIGLLFIIFLTINSCTKNDGPDTIQIAKVGDNILYASDVSNFIPKNVSGEDSVLMADDYIHKWIKNELIIKKAEENLTSEQKDVSKEIKEYRNSLIIYKYKRELMRQKMDTSITEMEIENYYNQNSNNFKLNKNIVKAIYVKIPTEVANPEQLKLYCSDFSEENLNELKQYCLQYAKAFDIFNDNWMYFDIVLNNIPVEIDDQERFLNRNQIIEKTESDYYYLVCINDYRLAGQEAPIAFISTQIKELIINNRKIEFLKKVEDDIYQEGIKNRKIKIYQFQN